MTKTRASVIFVTLTTSLHSWSLGNKMGGRWSLWEMSQLAKELFWVVIHYHCTPRLGREQHKHRWGNDNISSTPLHWEVCMLGRNDVNKPICQNVDQYYSFPDTSNVIFLNQWPSACQLYRHNKGHSNNIKHYSHNMESQKQGRQTKVSPIWPKH